MKTQQIDAPQDFPVMLSDAAWQSIHPFLQTLPNVYVGAPEDCRRFLSALIWITKEGATWRSLPKVYGYWNPSIDVSADGAMPGSLKNSMNISMRRVSSPRSSLIQRSCGHMLLQQVPQKKRRSAIRSTRSESRRLYHETRCCGE